MLEQMTVSVRSNQTERGQRLAMFNMLPLVLALSGSRPTMLSGVNMSYIISLHSSFASWFEQAREWFRHSLRPRTGGPNDERCSPQDDLYEIFLFGPHG